MYFSNIPSPFLVKPRISIFYDLPKLHVIFFLRAKYWWWFTNMKDFLGSFPSLSLPVLSLFEGHISLSINSHWPWLMRWDWRGAGKYLNLWSWFGWFLPLVHALIIIKWFCSYKNRMYQIVLHFVICSLFYFLFLYCKFICLHCLFLLTPAIKHSLIDWLIDWNKEKLDWFH